MSETENTQEVNDWLAKSNQLLMAAVALSGNPTVDRATVSMMRQCRTMAQSFLQALNNLPPEAPPTPPPGATGATGATGP